MGHRAVWKLIAAVGFAVCVGACSGAAPDPAPPPPKPPPIQVKKELPKPKTGVRTLTDDTVRKVFESEAKVQGTNGRKCGVWRDRVIITQPNDKGSNDLRIRPRGDDLDEDCQWDGPTLVEARVEGEVLGVVWPHVVLFKPGLNGVGRLEVLHGTTGGVTAEIVDAFGPSYVRSFVIGFGVPLKAEFERAPDEPCHVAIERAWGKVLGELESGGRIHPDMERGLPSCDPGVLRTCEDVAFMIPNEIVLTDTRAVPAAGVVGCIHMPAK